MCISGQEDFETGLFAKKPRVIRDSLSEDVPITLAMDLVALEGIETGTLRLVFAPGSLKPVGTFFRMDLPVTIIDTSSECKNSSIAQSSFSQYVSFNKQIHFQSLHCNAHLKSCLARSSLKKDFSGVYNIFI